MSKARLRLDEPTTPECFAGYHPTLGPFASLQLHAVQEVEIQQVGPCVWVFLKRQDGSLVRVWIGPPERQTRSTEVSGTRRGMRLDENRRATRPLTLTVETDTL